MKWNTKKEITANRKRNYDMKSIYEAISGTYTQQGDYRLPNLTMFEKSTNSTCVWAQRRLHYLKQNHKVLNYNPLTAESLHSHLADIEQKADTLLQVVKQYAEEVGRS